MSVKRYELTEMNPYGYQSHREMMEDKDGDYVRYEDYQALEAEMKECQKENANMAIELMNWRQAAKHQ